MQNFSGIFPPMLTPFKQNGDVDYDVFVRNIERWNKTGLSGYLVLGSNSETPYLNEEEKLTLIELTVQEAAKGRPVLAGTGLESTRATIALTNKAAKRGVTAALILTPSFYTGQMTDEVLIHHFTAVADRADIPILIYNVPKFSHYNISSKAVHILSQHNNIIGMKDSAGDIAQLQAFKSVVPADFNVLVGSASVLHPAFNLGIRAGILALANCAPEACVTIQQLHDAGNQQEAWELQAKMIPVNKAVTETFGIAGLKYACSLLGYEGGHVRSPLVPMNDERKSALREILVTAGLNPGK